MNNQRFVSFAASNPVALVDSLNEHMEDLGHCIYFGKGKIGWIAVFDMAPLFVLDGSETDNMSSLEQDQQDVLVHILKLKTTQSA